MLFLFSPLDPTTNKYAARPNWFPPSVQTGGNQNADTALCCYNSSFQPSAVAATKQLKTKNNPADGLPLRAGIICLVIGIGVLFCLRRNDVHECSEYPVTTVKLEPLVIVGSTDNCYLRASNDRVDKGRIKTGTVAQIGIGVYGCQHILFVLIRLLILGRVRRLCIVGVRTVRLSFIGWSGRLVRGLVIRAGVICFGVSGFLRLYGQIFGHIVYKCGENPKPIFQL